MAKIIDVLISIEGQTIKNFLSLNLMQAANVHHTFELVIPYDYVNSKTNLVINDASKFIGADISIGLYEKGTKKGNDFVGVITQLQHRRASSGINCIVVSGCSKTIHLDGVLNNSAFLNKKPSDVIKEIAKKYGLKLSVGIAGESPLEYIAQYRETDFAFIRRLAAERGQSFYYDGKELVVGKVVTKSAIGLSYPKELTDFSFGMKTIPVKNTYTDYDYLENSIVKKEITKTPKVHSSIYSGIGKESDKVFSSANVVGHTVGPEELAKAAAAITENFAANMTTVFGTSDNPLINLASVVNISLQATRASGAASDGDYGKFKVNAITHKVDGIGNYECNFEGVSDASQHFPNPYSQFVPSSNQIAVVVKHDEEKRFAGRVQVRFKWMDTNQSTGWIRVSSQYAGKGRGVFFTPEVDDEVIVQFDGGNPSKPMVVGSLHHGKAQLEGKFSVDNSLGKIKSKFEQDWKKNNVKQIVSQSGNRIVLNDEKGKEEIQVITAQGKNGILLSVKDGQISIFSEKKLVIASNDIEMIAKNNITMEAQSGNVTIKSGKNLDVDATQNITVKAGMKGTIQTQTDLNVKAGTKAVVEGSIQVELKGAMIKSAASGVNQVQGNIVMIN